MQTSDISLYLKERISEKSDFHEIFAFESHHDFMPPFDRERSPHPFQNFTLLHAALCFRFILIQCIHSEPARRAKIRKVHLEFQVSRAFLRAAAAARPIV